MKKFTKLFLSCAAVTAVTAAVASSAMAANLSGVEYVEPTGESDVAQVKITLPEAFTDQSKTLLILAKDTTLAEAAAAPSTDTIMQVQQYDEAINGNELLVPISALTEGEDDGTYRVYMGGTSGTIYEGSFTLGAVEALVGDADGNTRITPNDSVVTLQWIAGDKTKVSDENFMKAAYSDGNTRITPNDSVEMLKWIAGDKNREHVGKTEALPAAQ